MISDAYSRVHANLQKLNLSTIDEVLDAYLERAVKEKIPLIDVLDYIFNEEQLARMNQRCQRSLEQSNIPYIKRLEDFDFSFQSSIDPGIINELKTLRFIHNAENVVFLGPPGVGKTHLAISIGMKAIENGMRVYFINAATLLEKLMKAQRKGTLTRLIHKLTNYDLLIIDEIGYVPFNADAAFCFFQLVCSRYEHNSFIFTSNKSFAQWGEIFIDPIVTTAVLDRLLHHCITINIRGNSYRMKEKEETYLKLSKMNV